MSKKSRRNSHHSKRTHYTVLPHFLTPLVFVLVAMIVVAPMLSGGLQYAVKAVHSAQKTLTRDYNDIEIKDDKDSNAQLCEPAGFIECKQIGLKSDVFYGVNRVSFRDGVGVEEDENVIRMAGYSSTAFKPLLKAEVDDVFVYTTKDAETMYQVVDISSKNDYKPDDSKYLVLCTTKSNAPFAIYDDEMLYVTAKEVHYE